MKNVLWRVANSLSYIEDARCLKVNRKTGLLSFTTPSTAAPSTDSETSKTKLRLKTILSQMCDKIICTFQIKFIFLLLYLLSFYPPSFRLSYVLASFCMSSFPTYSFSYCATNRKVAGSIPDNVIGIFL